MAVPTSLCLKEALWEFVTVPRDKGSNVLFEEAQTPLTLRLPRPQGFPFPMNDKEKA